MAGLPIFLTKNSVSITIEYLSLSGSRNDIGEPIFDSITVNDIGVFDSFPEPGYTGQYEQSNQGKDTRQRFRLFVGPDVILQSGDYVESGGARFEVGFVTPYETHQEAIVFKV